jgi:hypothetical protein
VAQYTFGSVTLSIFPFPLSEPDPSEFSRPYLSTLAQGCLLTIEIVVNQVSVALGLGSFTESTVWSGFTRTHPFTNFVTHTWAMMRLESAKFTAG